jgi:hypothetical protein
MPKLIPPTPGRVVWYYPSQHEIDAKTLAIYDAAPLAAVVAFVHTDRLVNLALFDHAGAAHRRTSVTLLQEDDETPHTSEGPYAAWMPYQLGQAAKAAEADSLQALAVVLVDPAAPGAEQTAETKVYTDGTSATGTAPLPDLSPAQQLMADATQLADAVTGIPADPQPDGSATNAGAQLGEPAPETPATPEVEQAPA